MQNLFIGATVIASYIEDDYQGSEGFVYQLSDGRVVLLNDYFGSCSGCDSWEDADDEEVRYLVNELCNNSKIVESAKEAVDFLEQAEVRDGEYFAWRSLSSELLKQLKVLETPKLTSTDDMNA